MIQASHSAPTAHPHKGRWGRRVALALGAVAVLGLLGALSAFPPFLGFFACALPIILFPGIVLGNLVGNNWIEKQSFPERLAIWFLLGIGVTSCAGYMGLVFHIRLETLAAVMIAAYAALGLLLVLRPAQRQPSRALPPVNDRRVWIDAAVLSIALGAAILTLVSARDFDDWYYISYMRDYVVGKPLGMGDAVFDMGRPLPPRVWFGGSWWVTGALVAKVSGIDPVGCQQIYMPLLTTPAGVFAVFTLATWLFRSYRAGLLGCSLQVICYLAGAFPQKSAGWFFFCRMAQDKAVSFFVAAPLAAACAIGLIARSRERNGLTPRGLYGVYVLAVVVSFLIHGMGPVWCGLLILPFALVEWLHSRAGASARATAMVALPIAACGLVLVILRGLMAGFIEAPGEEAVHISQAVAVPYFPGRPFVKLIETAHPIVWFVRKHISILNPLFLTRFPMAWAGLVLTFFLIPKLRSDLSARFLFILTALTLFLAYVPAGAALTSQFMTDRLLFRLAWLFPWGLTITFFLLRLGRKPLLRWLVVAGIALGLARGNPANLVAPLARMYERNRPWPEAVEILQFIGSEPSPQGAVLAPDMVSRMIPAFLPDAVPVNFRDEGAIDRERLKKLLSEWRVRRNLLKEIRKNNVRYVVLENGTAVARSFSSKTRLFTELHRNGTYTVFLVREDESTDE